jgi:hypothetical protein
MTDTVQDGTLRTRRSLLTAAAGGAAALAVSAIKPGAVAAGVVEPVNQDVDNATVAITEISNATDGVDAFAGNATGDGTGSVGTSDTGIGVMGVSDVSSDPETNTRNAGVVGVAGSTGNIATNIALTGVYGVSDASPDTEVTVASGVWGESGDWGVIGFGSGGVLGDGAIGVLGGTATPDGFGLFGVSDDPQGFGLAVAGRAVFSRSGRATVNAGSKKEVVNLAGCTANTLVIAVLAQNRAGRYVRAAVPEAGKFTIYLNNDVGSNTKVSWIAFSNPATLTG